MTPPGWRPTYRAALDLLWEQATAPRAEDAPVMVSTFAGMGGSTLGYLAAGFRELLAVDHDEHAAACLRENFAARVWCGDIAELDPAELGIAPGELDLLDGSPPCQGFSTLGKRHRDDPRNGLFAQFVRLVSAWQPRALVMENVRGMVYDRATFSAVYETLTGAGYRLRAAILPAALFGAATARDRLIIVGAREDLGIDPTHPGATARPVTVREAWRDLPAETVALPRPLSARITRLALMIEPGKGGQHALSSRGGRKSYYNLKRLTWDRPGPTMTSTHRESDYLHPAEQRYLTIREMTRIQGVPDQYAWPEGTTYDQAHNRIGNSVSPLLARALGEHVRATILARVPAHSG